MTKAVEIMDLARQLFDKIEDYQIDNESLGTEVLERIQEQLRYLLFPEEGAE